MSVRFGHVSWKNPDNNREYFKNLQIRPERVERKLDEIENLRGRETREIFAAFHDELTEYGRLRQVNWFLNKHKNVEAAIDFIDDCLDELMSRSYDLDPLSERCSEKKIHLLNAEYARLDKEMDHLGIMQQKLVEKRWAKAG